VANLELKRLDSGEQFTVATEQELFQELQPKPANSLCRAEERQDFSDDYSI